MVTDFTFESYRSLLGFLGASREYVLFRDFKDDPPTGPVVLLRHDIDFSTRAALEMARVEAECGVKSTYFFLFSEPLYNLLSGENVRVPRQVAELGHEVGLHYDVRALERAAADRPPEEVLFREVALLSAITGTEIHTIAMHNPSTSGQDPFRDTGLINAYDARFTEEMRYFSDSCGAWRDEFVECVENETVPDRVQLTIHPMYWSDTARTRWQCLQQLLDDRTEELSGIADGIRRIWDNHPGVAQHDERNPPATPGSSPRSSIAGGGRSQVTSED